MHTVAIEEIPAQVAQFLKTRSTSVNYMEEGKGLLVEIRLAGRKITDPVQRVEYAQLARDVAERLLDVTGEYYPIHLEPFNVEELQTFDAFVAPLERLALLPLASLPTPAPLPSGSCMPFSRNPLFVGREEELKMLAALFKGSEPGATMPTVALTGLGGIGKTQLAIEFVHRYGQFFAGGVFWLDFADAHTLGPQVAACGSPGHMGLYRDADGFKLDEQVSLVQQAWSQDVPRLLVFDNCEDEALLAQWRPTTGGCRILVTSRRATWDAGLGVTTVALSGLPRQASIALLEEFLAQASDEGNRASEYHTLDAIAAELGDLPLALHLASSFLHRYRQVVTPQQYLEELRKRHLLEHRSLQGWRLEQTTSPTQHEQHVARTFALSYDQLDAADATDALALRLLARAACFAPGVAIPYTLLLATLGLEEDAPDAAIAAEDALLRLLELGLLEREETGEVRMHRLLAVFVQGVTEDATAQADVEQTILDFMDSRIDQAGFLGALPAYDPHMRHVAATALGRGDERAARLAHNLAYYLEQIGDYATARPLLARALSIRERVLGADHPATASSLNNLAELLAAQGQYPTARPLYERALAIREQVLGADHPDTANSLNNLAELLAAQGDYAAARPLYERALAIYERVLGADHPATASSLNNLAVLLVAQGEYTAARPYLERALAIREQVLGPTHPATAASLNSLGNLLASRGEYTAARPYLERALTIYEQVLGPTHPHTVQTLNNLAQLPTHEATL